MTLRTGLLTLAALAPLVLLTNCMTMSDEELDRHLAEKERRQEERLERRTKVGDSMGRRWQRMADWEEERSQAAWDRHMGRDPDSEWDF